MWDCVMFYVCTCTDISEGVRLYTKQFKYYEEKNTYIYIYIFAILYQKYSNKEMVRLISGI